MNKSKTLLATLLACSLLLVGCNSSNKDDDSKNKGNPTSQNPGSTPLNPLDQIFKDLTDIVNAPNVSMNMTLTASRTHDGVTVNSHVEGSYKYDNNKIYAQMTQFDLSVNPPKANTNEYYYEFGGEGEKSYQYMKLSEQWKKIEIGYMDLRPSSQIKGFEQMMMKFKQSCTLTQQGYFSESFTITMPTRDILEAAGRNPDDYIINQESIDLTYTNALIGIENGAPSYLQVDSHGISISTVKSPEEEKAHAVVKVELDAPCSTKMHNFHDLGTTVVTLPNIE